MAKSNTSNKKGEKEVTALMELQILEREDQERMESMKKTLADMREAVKRQPNISQVVKTGLQVMVELCDGLVAREKKRTVLQKKLIEEAQKLSRWSPAKALKGGSQKRPRTGEPSDIILDEETEMETDASSFPVSDSDAGSARDLKTYEKKTDLSKGEISKEVERAKTDEERLSKIRKQEEVERHRIEKQQSSRVRVLEPKKEKTKDTQNNKKKKEGGSNRRTALRLKRKNNRPEALVIKVSEQTPYAEVLRKLKEGVDPAKTNTEIRTIKKTGKGDVMLEMSRSCKITKDFRKAVEDAVGKGLIKDLTPRASLEIRDIDCLTTVDEVKEAIESKLGKGKIDHLTVHLTPPNQREQRAAIVTLTGEDAEKLMADGKLRCGWVSCRLRRRVEVSRCYNCLGFGHLSRDCRGSDRTDTCFKCGKIGHKAAACQGPINCPLCVEIGGVPSNHQAGKKGCTAFRRALERREPERP